MERLYYTDAYIDSFTAVITDITDEGVVTDKTAFFPEGGGQSSDRGTLSGYRVYDVKEKDGVIYHKIKGDFPFNVGDTVEGKIDFKKRFSDMQNHTGEHIFSGIVHRELGYDNVGFHLNDKEVALDFSGEIPDEKIAEIEKKANEAVWKNIEVKAFFPNEDERKSIAYRSKKEIEGSLRLVEIKNVDICACCAPHVKRTGEIGIIKVVGHEKHRMGTRVFILCGERALEDYSLKQSENKKIGILLKTPEYETSGAVESLINKKYELEYEIGKLNTESAKRAADAYENGDIIVAVDLFTGQTLTYFANYIKEKASLLAAVFGKECDNKYSYMLISDGRDISQLVKDMNTALCGRGGGRNGSARGSVSCTREEIYNFFKNISILK